MKRTGQIVGKAARIAAALALAAGLAIATGTGTAWAGGEDWNDAQIKWMPYADGIKAARESGKPICLIFYTTWCPHCANYSRVFYDPKVVEQAKSFVMIRVDKDKARDISAQYKPDGEYIPRTYFLSPDGKLDESITEARPQYKYFYNEQDAAGILGGMSKALKKLGARSAS
ncbi:thioredoxin family protein [Candidatus Binatia bacterium]|nr:thioredoxin family protein [Candidatus Binatia bacterium]